VGHLAKKVQEAIKQMYDVSDQIDKHNVKFDLEWLHQALKENIFPTPAPWINIAAPFQPVSVPIYPVEPMKYVYDEFTVTKRRPKPLPRRTDPPWNLND
jgi:hypothetical protein